MKLGGFRIKVHSNPGTIGNSFLLLLHMAFFLPASLTVADFSPFFIVIEIRKWLRSENQKIRRGQERRRRRRDLEKCPRPQMVAFLNLG